MVGEQCAKRFGTQLTGPNKLVRAIPWASIKKTFMTATLVSYSVIVSGGWKQVDAAVTSLNPQAAPGRPFGGFGREVVEELLGSSELSLVQRRFLIGNELLEALFGCVGGPPLACLLVFDGCVIYLHYNRQRRASLQTGRHTYGSRYHESAMTPLCSAVVQEGDLFNHHFKNVVIVSVTTNTFYSRYFTTQEGMIVLYPVRLTDLSFSTRCSYFFSPLPR